MSHFERANVLIYDPVPANRQTTTGILHTLGFREIVPVRVEAEIEPKIASVNPDVFVLDLTEETPSLCRYIRAIREGRIGLNPFLVIIATTWRLDQEMISAALEAGIDDLVARPFSTAMLQKRAAAQLEARKPFVVTSDYVGPDRRTGQREDSAPVPLIEVPNTFKEKVVNGASPEEAFAAVQEARQDVGHKRIERLAIHIGILAQFLHDSAQANGGTVVDGQEGADLDAMRTALETLTEKASGTKHHAVIGLCDALMKILNPEIGLHLDMKRVTLIRQMALAIRRAVSPEDGEADMVKDILDTVGRIKARSVMRG